MIFFTRTSILMLSAAMLLVLPATANAFTEAEKAELGTVIREYVLNNPELILEAVEKHRMNETEKAEAETQNYLKDNYNALINKDLPAIGSETPDVTIVEFMDYNCGYCKRALPDITKLIEDDKKVRIVFHEMPVLGPSSQMASMWALAAHKQGKYFEYHSALMNFNGQKGEKELEKLAQDVGLDIEQIKKDAASEEVKSILSTSMSIAENLDIQGTPAFIVGKTAYRGYIGHDGLIAALKQEREQGTQ
jgi:protein-disulfide isomerase